MKKLIGLCLLLTAFIAVNADAIPRDPVNIADEVEEDRDDIDEEDEEDRDDIDEEDEEDYYIDEDDVDVEDRMDSGQNKEVCKEDEEYGIRCHAKALGKKIYTGTIRTNSARACQIQCERWNNRNPDGPECKFFTWRDRDFKAKWRKRRRCYLLQGWFEVKKRVNWAWGPAY